MLQTRKNPSSSLLSLGWRGRKRQTVCKGGGQLSGTQTVTRFPPFSQLLRYTRVLGFQSDSKPAREWSRLCAEGHFLVWRRTLSRGSGFDLLGSNTKLDLPASSTLLLSGHSALMPSSFTFWDLLPPSHRTSGALPEWPSGSCSHLLLRTFSQFSQLAGWTTSEESCFFQIYSISEWWRATCSRQHSVPQTFAKIQKNKIKISFHSHSRVLFIRLLFLSFSFSMRHVTFERVWKPYKVKLLQNV